MPDILRHIIRSNVRCYWNEKSEELSEVDQVSVMLLGRYFSNTCRKSTQEFPTFHIHVWALNWIANCKKESINISRTSSLHSKFEFDAVEPTGLGFFYWKNYKSLRNQSPSSSSPSISSIKSKCNMEHPEKMRTGLRRDCCFSFDAIRLKNRKKERLMLYLRRPTEKPIWFQIQNQNRGNFQFNHFDSTLSSSISWNSRAGNFYT
jgi:hypothetical protein